MKGATFTLAIPFTQSRAGRPHARGHQNTKSQFLPSISEAYTRPLDIVAPSIPEAPAGLPVLFRPFLYRPYLFTAV